jgi:ABC-type lipoprotein export system ATPase subunit
VSVLAPTAPPGLLVDCEGLVHIYKTADLEVVALQGLDLRVRDGETIAIAGRSGSGKTTLMNILAGMEPPTAGRARVAGRDLARLAPGERVRYRRSVVGYLFQHSHLNLLPELTALQNVQIPMVDTAGEERGARATELLDGLGLAGAANRLPPELSGGESQRLALAVALANRPLLLLADEPTAELDSTSARSLLEDLAALLAAARTAAIVVTHDTQVERYVDRVVQIRDGRTSTEMRWEERDGSMVARDLVIMDRAGRLQLPRSYVEKLGLRDRVEVLLEEDSIRIVPHHAEGGDDA